jgi:hypothetical protein
LRLAGLLLGIALFLWLPFEDRSVNWALSFAGGISLWGATRFLVDRQTVGWRLLVRHAWVGTLAGLAVAPLALLLMVFKSGVHAHGFPDFTYDQMQTVLLRTPVWTSSGLLLGLGSGIWRGEHSKVVRQPAVK